MRRPGSDRGRRSGAGGKTSSSTGRRGEPRSRGSAMDGPPGESRLLLTRLIHEGAVWNVYVATTAQPSGPNRTQLEFENAKTESERHVRRAEGPLLNALYSGEPVSRSSLQSELVLALVDAGSARAGDQAARDPDLPDDILKETA